MSNEPKTAGIPPAQSGALSVLQFHKHGFDPSSPDDSAVAEAAREVLSYHAATPEQKVRLAEIESVFVVAAVEIVRLCPAGPERSTGISRLREAKMWASAGIALEGK